MTLTLTLTLTKWTCGAVTVVLLPHARSLSERVGFIGGHRGCPDPAALAAAGALQVELRAGELLYLPPLWFHEVESLSDAVSVNGWSDAAEGDP